MNTCTGPYTNPNATSYLLILLIAPPLAVYMNNLAGGERRIKVEGRRIAVERGPCVPAGSGSGEGRVRRDPVERRPAARARRLAGVGGVPRCARSLSLSPCGL